MKPKFQWERSKFQNPMRTTIFNNGFLRICGGLMGYNPPNSVTILWNVPVNDTPSALTAPIITTAIPAAIKPYSMAVAPDSFFAAFRTLALNSLNITPPLIFILPHT
jgi:hypothetical protein